MAERWLVALTQSRRELWAAENIDRLGAEFYFPKMQVITKRGHLSIASIEPLFPRHIFVRSDNGQWRFLTGVWGIAGVIMAGQQPGFMPAHEIHRLKAAEDQDGMVVLPDLDMSERFKNGEAVRVNNGAFSGMNGIYQGVVAKDRVKVLLNVLGRKTTVLIADSHIEAV